MSEEPIKLFARRSERYPEPDGADKVHTGIRAGLATIPVLGGPAVELFSAVIAPPLAQRRDNFLKEMADDLEDVQRKVEGFNVEDLVNNDVFVTAAIQATRIAVSTHIRDKHEMLRNALLNIALGKGPAQEDLQQAFLNAIEAFSPTHMKILNVYRNGLTELNKAGLWNTLQPYSISNYTIAIGKLYPELNGQEGLIQFAMNDIRNRGFATISRPGDSFPQSPGVTNIGVEFLNFVLEPPKY